MTFMVKNAFLMNWGFFYFFFFFKIMLIFHIQNQIAIFYR